MRHTRLLAIAAAVATLVAGVAVAHAGETRAKTLKSGDGSGQAKYAYYRKRPLEVTIYGRRRVGGYSYRRADAISTFGRSPPPYLDVRQSPGGPFDSGFFFDSGMSPRGGNSLWFR